MADVSSSVIDIRYISGAEVSVSRDGDVVIVTSWVECPVLQQRRITMRTAASVETAEKFCRKLMAALGIKEN